VKLYDNLPRKHSVVAQLVL